ncbi:hypothetical protein GGH94_004621 [Coemansia aciculifera]|uniref:Pre-mRNA processing factor 4 (PRP4)-like domain-containing protein n=1 Tax=Coemansia aciculifera TaxID=417176 RepID=A0A9W8M3E5_9FUNG|nr:hypothetical protein GGH94_004621 [Coemansia aciculifera]
MSHREQSRGDTYEQDVVAYAKRKREEEEDEVRTEREQRLAKGIPESRSGIQGIDLDLIDEVLDDSEDRALTDEALEKRRRAMAEFERKKLARTIATPTDDKLVKEQLRKHNHPICLFGEDAGDRRNRLRYILSKIAMEQRASGGDTADGQAEAMTIEDDDAMDEDEAQTEEFYTEGTNELLQARRDIAVFSLAKARARTERQREDCKVDLVDVRKRRQDLVKRLDSYSNYGSQVGDTRPISRIIFSPDCQNLLTSSWSGAIKLWDVPHCRPIRTFCGHTDRVGGISFHPKATLGLGDETADFASGAADTLIHLWSLNKERPIAKLQGHQSRVVHVQHHPNGAYLGSASYDGSWRLWDIASQKELLLQEGHSREIFALRFQCDGALVATGGLDGICRVWDMRSGRSLVTIESHAKEIFGIDWSPNGYQVATGSADNTVRIFDMRKLGSIYQIPAHKSLITDVRFFHASHAASLSSSASRDKDRDMDTSDDSTTQCGDRLCDGQYLVSASNDGLVNIWSAGDWKLQKSLAGHVGKVMSVDIASNGSYIASSGYDRTFKLWGPEDF